MIEMIAVHARVLGKGFVRMLVGAATACIAGLGIYGFAVVSRETGYAAVGDFLLSVLAMVLAVAGVYLMGGSCKKKGAKK